MDNLPTNEQLRANHKIKSLWEILNAIGCELEGYAGPVPRASHWSNDDGESGEGFYLYRATRENFSDEDIKTIRRVADSVGFKLRTHSDFERIDDRTYMPSLTFDL